MKVVINVNVFRSTLRLFLRTWPGVALAFVFLASHVFYTLCYLFLTAWRAVFPLSKLNPSSWPTDDSRKRVLLFSEHDLDTDFRSGVMTNAVTLLSTLESQGYDVEVVSPKHCILQFDTPTKEAEGIKTVFASPLFLYRKIAEHHSSVIIFTSEFLLCQQARVACFFHNKTYLARLATRWDCFLNDWFLMPKWFSRIFLRNIIHVLDEHLGVIAEPIMVYGRDTLKLRGTFHHFPQTIRNEFWNKPLPDKDKGRKPVFISVGRVSSEKNIEAFLEWKVDGIKHVVGDGPVLEQYKKDYPEVTFHGRLDGEELVDAFDLADYFVFPSRTDTFGMVAVEALSRGLPIIAYAQEMGPNCVVGGTMVDTLAPTLGESYAKAQHITPAQCIESAQRYSPTALFEAFLKIEAALEAQKRPPVKRKKTSEEERAA